MDLSNNLISQFAKITKDQNGSSNETIVYGTAVSYGDKLYVNIDGSDSITPVVTTSEVKAGERVTILLKDHSATILGNVTNPAASTETVGKILDDYDTIVARIGNFELVIADKVSTEQLEAELAIIDEALIGKATIDQLHAIDAKIDNLGVDNLKADVASINQALIGKAEIVDLEAVRASIDLLETDVANIETLVGGHLTMDNIQSLVLTSSKVTVDNAFIKDAMIDRVSANKINTGTINTNNVNIQSSDGSMILRGSLQQFKDEAGNVRIQIGKDATGDFTFALYGADGQGQLINQNGITASAISDGLIVNDMVADNANISGSKLDIDSVITEVNGSTKTIKSSKIYFDDKKQSLDVVFNRLDTTVNNTSSTVSSHTTSINTMQGQIGTLISDTTITNENGTTTSVKDAYSSMKQTVNGISTKVGSLETTMNNGFKTVNSKISSVEQTLDGVTTRVSSTETKLEDLKDEMYLGDTMPTTDGSVVYIRDKFAETVTTVDGITNKVGSIEANFGPNGTVTNLVKQVSSLEQTASQFTMEFFNKVENAEQGVNTILDYITFDANGITIGQENYPVRLRLTKDRVKFIDIHDTQLAYFSEGKLYVNKAEIIDSIKIANYGFLPTANGSLTIGAIS